MFRSMKNEKWKKINLLLLLHVMSTPPDLNAVTGLVRKKVCMYIVQAKSGEGAEQACTYDASYHPSSLIRCLPFRHLQTCTPQPPLPTTPA